MLLHFLIHIFANNKISHIRLLILHIFNIMKRLNTILCMVAVIATISAKTIWFGDMMQKALSSPNTVQPQSTRFHCEIAPDSTSATFSFSIPSADVECDSLLYPESYWWTADDFYPSCVAGEPSLPQRSLIFQLPGNAENITLTENHSQWQIIENFTPTPARPPLLMETGACHSLDNVQPISKYISLNSPVASISAITRQRTSKLVYVHLQPFKYEGGNTVSVCYNFSYTLTFDKSNKPVRQILINKDLTQTESDSPENVSPFNLDSLADNWDELNQLARDVHECRKYIRPSNYLIITTPKYYNSIKNYGEWKKKLGHNVRIVTKTAWSQDLIKSTIAANYIADSALHYILLAGSINEIPATDRILYGDSIDKDYSDFPYAVLYNDKTRPGYERSVFTGRLLVDYPEQMPIVLNKLRYCYYVGAHNPDYHLNASHVSFFDSKGDTENRTFMVKTSEDIRNHVIDNGKSVARLYYKHFKSTPKYWRSSKHEVSEMPYNLQYPQFPWSADSTDVINAFSKGCHYILYNGHGGQTSWGYGDNWKKPVFATEFIPRLNNTENLPFVFGITCNTGDFRHRRGLAKSLLNSRFGAISVIASTRSILCINASTLALGIFKTIWPNPEYDTNFLDPDRTISLDPYQFAYDNKHNCYVQEERLTLGNILDLATRYTYFSNLIYQPTNQTNNHEIKNFFHIYGDPGVFFNTETPVDIENVHFSINSISNHLTNSTIHYFTISLEDNVIIGVYNKTTNAVTRYYTNRVDHIVGEHDTYHVVITQHNKRPLEFYVEDGVISASGPYIGDEVQTPVLRMTNVTQTGTNTINVSYSFDKTECMEYNGTIAVKDLSNNTLAEESVTDECGTISLSAPGMRPGINVVVSQGITHAPSYQKILIK